MGKNIKLPLDTGFTALCGHIKAIRTMAEQSGSAVADLAEATAATTAEIEGILNGKQNTGTAVQFTIPVSGWKSGGSVGYPQYYDIAVAGLTAGDRAEITIAADSLSTAKACGMCPTNETMAGRIRVRAASVPTEDISAEYWIQNGKE